MSPDVNTLCRICLSHKTHMISLNNPWDDNESPSSTKPQSVGDVLETVMSVKVIQAQKYPCRVCLECKNLLKISYELYLSFHESQNLLKAWYKEAPIKNSKESESPKAPVELIVGSNSFDINDILIVDDEQESVGNFEGFLNNLGHSVSAHFVNKPTSKKKYKSSRIAKINAVDKHYTLRILDDQSNDMTDAAHIADKDDISLNLNLGPNQIHSQICASCGNLFTYENSTGVNVLCIKCTAETWVKKEYKCDVCDYVSDCRYKTFRHKRRHFGCRFVCNICDKKYLTKLALSYHIKKHKNIRNQLCTVCGITFLYESALLYHMRTHSTELKYCCSYCARRFKILSSLKRHERTHTGIRPFGCSYCEKFFFSVGEKKRHEMLHTGYRPYKCKYCDKGFTSSYNRRIHHMAHSGSHACQFCTRTFIEIDLLKRHVNLKHKSEIVLE